MRLLDVNSFYSPSGGGTRTYHHRKLEYCSGKDGITAALVVPDTVYSREETGLGTIYRVPCPPLFDTGYRMIVGGGYVERVVDDFAPDIIEVGSCYLMPDIVRRIAVPRGIPRVGFYHADYPDTLVSLTLGRVPLLGGGIVRWCWKRVARTYGDMAAVVGASRYVMEKLRRAGIRRLYHVPLGVDHGLFAPAKRSEDVRREAGAADGRKLLLYLARLNPEKGIDLLMEAWPMFGGRGEVALLVVGNGVLERKVRRFASRFPEVRLLPFTGDQARVAELMASCDVFLSLGPLETFCLATLEAMASGSVVVAPDSGGAGELVRDSGFLEPFTPGDPASLVESIGRSLLLPGEDTGGQYRRYSMKYTWDRTFDSLFSVYRRVLEARDGGSFEGLAHPDGWWTP